MLEFLRVMREWGVFFFKLSNVKIGFFKINVIEMNGDLQFQVVIYSVPVLCESRCQLQKLGCFVLRVILELQK